MKNSATQRKNGIILGYLVLVLDTVIGLVYTPILLKSLGDGEYGLYQLIGSLVNYFAIMDLGLGSTITRYMVKYQTEKDETGRDNFFAMALSIYGIISLLIFTLGMVLQLFIGDIFKGLSEAEVIKARILFGFLIINLIIALFDHAFSGVLTANEQFTLEKGLKVSRVVVRAGLVIGLIQLWSSSVVIVVVDFVLTLVILCIKISVVLGKLNIKPRLIKFEKDLFREVFFFTSAIFLQAIINQFNNNVDKTVLGIYKSTATVAIYSVAMQIYSAYAGISTAVQSVYLPQISRGVFRGDDNHKITMSLVPPARLQFIVLFAVCSGFWLHGFEFIQLWCGKTEAWIIACMVMSAGMVELFQNTTTSVLKAKNLMLGRTLINLFTALGNFVITLLLVPKLGMIGAALGTVFTLIVGYIIINNIYYRFCVGIEVWTFFKSVFNGLLPAVILGTVVGSLTKLIPIGVSWGGFAIRLAGFVVVYGLSVYFVGLNTAERRMIQKNVLHKK